MHPVPPSLHVELLLYGGTGEGSGSGCGGARFSEPHGEVVSGGEGLADAFDRFVRSVMWDFNGDPCVRWEILALQVWHKPFESGIGVTHVDAPFIGHANRNGWRLFVLLCPCGACHLEKQREQQGKDQIGCGITLIHGYALGCICLYS
jgi:hypothetical protein